MALLSFAALTVNGTPLSGDVAMASIGGVDVSSDHIEVHEVQFGSRIAIDPQGRRSTGARRVLPLRLAKRIDGTTPELYQALTMNATIAGEVKIFDTDPDDGSTRLRFTLTLAKSRVTAIESRVPDVYDAEQGNRPPMEVVEIVPHTITYTDVVNGREFTEEASTPL
jgi:type VI secretion system Hcp family effector